MDEIPVLPDGDDADEEDINTSGRVTQLKREIDNDRYDVDAPAVADAILRRIRLLRQLRQGAKSNGAGRSPRRPEDRPDR